MSATSERIREEWAASDARRDAGLVTPEDVERFDSIPYGKDPKWNLLDVYRPRGKAEILPVIVSVHGGGWVYGDKELYQFYCMSLAQRGFAVVNFSYRLAPESKFPAPLEDTNRVIGWMYKNQEKYRLDMNHVFLVGDSAGGHLAGLYAAICTNPEYAAEYSFQVPCGFVPQALGLNCGVYAPLGTEAMQEQETLEDFLPENVSDREKRLLQVPDYVTPGYPPVYLMTCVGDFCRPQAPLLEKALKKNGVPYELAVYGDEKNPLYHVFHVTVQEPEGQRCNDAECAFFRRVMRQS